MSDMLQLVVRFGGFQLTAEVTATAANDKLKHIGHSLRIPVTLSVAQDNDKLIKRIGHSLQQFQ